MRTMLEAIDAGFGEVPPPPVADTIGMRLVAASATGEATLRARRRAVPPPNPMGTLHGGILGDLADAAMGWAYASRSARARRSPPSS